MFVSLKVLSLFFVTCISGLDELLDVFFLYDNMVIIVFHLDYRDFYNIHFRHKEGTLQKIQMSFPVLVI